jgi:choline dehydrogenase-like flavoprotein
VPAAAKTAYRRFALGRSSVARPLTIRLQTHSEQAPDPDSRVLLADQKDALGSRRARTEWRLGELERRTVEVMARTVGDELRRLGLAELHIDDWVTAEGEPSAWRLGDSYHHIGTTRMAARPTDGVVDPDCAMHCVRGLYVAGGSVFPTSGFANPTLTIAALALRLADHLKTTLQR